jgi:hypothetical protein
MIFDLAQPVDLASTPEGLPPPWPSGLADASLRGIALALGLGHRGLGVALGLPCARTRTRTLPFRRGQGTLGPRHPEPGSEPEHPLDRGRIQILGEPPDPRHVLASERRMGRGRERLQACPHLRPWYRLWTEATSGRARLLRTSGRGISKNY